MTTTVPLTADKPARQPRRGHRAVLAGLAVFIAVLAATIGALVAGHARHSPASGSGIPATEARALPAFTAVELAGSNRVIVKFGTSQRVVLHADTNLLDHVRTRVRSGVLTIDERGDFTTRSPMSVVLTVPNLHAVTLSGTGELTVTGVATTMFTARLSGTGTLTASGRADHVNASLAGAGTLMLASLQARNATVVLRGTGTAAVHATESLHATLAGTGTIVYGGNPAHVIKNMTGVGTIATQ